MNIQLEIGKTLKLRASSIYFLTSIVRTLFESHDSRAFISDYDRIFLFKQSQAQLLFVSLFILIIFVFIVVLKLADVFLDHLRYDFSPITDVVPLMAGALDLHLWP